MFEKLVIINELEKSLFRKILLDCPDSEKKFLIRKLLEFLTKTESHSWYLPEAPKISIEEQQILQEQIKRINQGEPLQYILGETWFLNRKFVVNPSVLIPRPETEEICQNIIQKYKYAQNIRILEPCTGSGCIAVSLALEIRGSKILATDISEKALETARLNAEKYSADVAFVQHDLLKGALGLPDQMDLLVCNPPYIPVEDIPEMHRRVVAFEPHQALFTPSGDTLLFYRKLADIGQKCLKPGGEIWLEIYESNSFPVKKILEDAGFEALVIHIDFLGRERAVSGKFRA